MPHNEKLVPKKHAFKILFGQRPLTRFCDYEQAITVDLIKHDDPTAMLEGTYNFVKATWSEDGKESSRASLAEQQEALKQMLSGKALGLGLETINFMFRISGITRVDTHQVVRQRVGIVFSQQCSGDTMWHHHNCLVEPSIRHSPFFSAFKDSTTRAKMLYAQMVDPSQLSPTISIQAARSVLPHNLETFLFAHTNLATLLFFHMKRIDDGSQTWAINSIARQMAEKVCRIFPDLEETFRANETKFTFQKKATEDRTNLFSTGLYKPWPDNVEYHNRDFLYSYTKIQMNLVREYSSPFLDEFYWGYEQVSEDQYNFIQQIYSKLDEHIADNHFSNEEILRLGKEATEELECAISKQ